MKIIQSINEKVLEKTIQRCRERNIIIPTFAQQKDPTKIPGSVKKRLADFVAKGLAERDACLMANHGQIAMGRDLGSALELAHEVEVLSEQYVKLLSLGVEPILLGDAEMAEVLDRFKGYGQNAQG